MTIRINMAEFLASSDSKHYEEYPLGDAPVGGTRTINGTGFGNTGPTVLHYDTFEANTDGQLIDLNGAEIGSPYTYNVDTAGNTGTAYAMDFDNKTWLATRQPQNVTQNQANMSSLRLDWGQTVKDFTFSFRWVIPTGFHFTDSTNPNEIAGSNNSRLKFNWFYENAISGGGSDDVVIPTVTSATVMEVSGNGVDPQSLSGGRRYYSFNNCSGVDENFMVWSQTENTGSNWDGVIERIQATTGFFSRITDTDCKPFEPNIGTPPFNGYQRAYIPGWMANHDTYVNTQMLYKDIYIATGAGHRAMILTHSQPTLAASGDQIYIVPPDTWSDTQITFTPKGYQNLTYVSVIDANGVLQENV